MPKHSHSRSSSNEPALGKELFLQVWPILSRWIAQNREASIRLRRSQQDSMSLWNEGFEEAMATQHPTCPICITYGCEREAASYCLKYKHIAGKAIISATLITSVSKKGIVPNQIVCRGVFCITPLITNKFKCHSSKL